MIIQKAYFFKTTTKGIKALLNRIIKNSIKAGSCCKALTINHIKSLVVRTYKRIERVYKICWAIERKNTEYFASGRLAHYSAGDIHRMVNASLVKDGLKPAAKSTLRGDIRVLKDLGLIRAVIQPLGEGNGGFAFYVINWKLWRNFKTIIKKHHEDKLIDTLAGVRIKGVFEDKIDAVSFDDVDDYEQIEQYAAASFKQNEEEMVLNAAPQNSTIIPKGIISLTNTKNSKKSILKKHREGGTSNKVGVVFGGIGTREESSYEEKDKRGRIEASDEKKKGGHISKSAGKVCLKAGGFKSSNNRQESLHAKAPPRRAAPRAAAAYKRSYEEHMECKLENKYSVNRHTLATIRRCSNNVATHRNALRNLEASLIYASDYAVEDVAGYYTKQFTQVYSNKVWMLNPNTDKTNDFYKVWGSFMDKYTNKYKQQELLGRVVYSDGYGNLRELDSSGRFKDSGAQSLGLLLDKFRQDISINEEVVS
ncbi:MULTISPECIES: plasmid maintenance protein [unclassified Borrelia]|uniref:plasmid maintenance protein n=1 Tax=unclassified Borrelia TaxID=2649934 RepID=UPI001E608545|nr:MULTISPECIES: plasmid maintenance protein [unclassified Borrelia]UGQ16666.1 plasmid maintenance protein [Borrelia sp. RT5S]UGQ17717.1 plasmid maintenance protein [Borrelia sp. RT1S]UGQ17823.1 plasmid maintenance protein [Borrelia sp. RT1S]